MRRLATGYLSAQIALAVAWWIAMILRPDWRPWFFAGESAQNLWRAFVGPDLVIFVGAGAAAAAGIARSAPWAKLVLWLHLGGVGYGTLICLSASILTGTAWPGALLMVGSSAAVAWIATVIRK